MARCAPGRRAPVCQSESPRKTAARCVDDHGARRVVRLRGARREIRARRLSRGHRRLPEAIARDPNDTDSTLYLTMALNPSGLFDIARDSASRMMAVDPFSWMSWVAVGLAQWFDGGMAGSIDLLSSGRPQAGAARRKALARPAATASVAARARLCTARPRPDASRRQCRRRNRRCARCSGASPSRSVVPRHQTRRR